MKRFLLWLCIAICSELTIQLLIEVMSSGTGVGLIVVYGMATTVAIFGIGCCWNSLQQIGQA